MNPKSLYEAFKAQFDLVSILNTSTYLEEATKLGKSDYPNYPTLVVVGLAYPKRIIHSTTTHLVPSFYTFGSDYHTVLKKRIEKIVSSLGVRYQLNVDNHPYDERLAATIGGLGYFAKNQLIINDQLGSYFFLGMVFIDVKIEHEITFEVDASCGSCTKCIDACPTSALSETGYDVNRCLSHLNQSKMLLDESIMKANYALFGCDICQMVCPKNSHKGIIEHDEFHLNGKELVSIEAIFTMSEKAFKEQYAGMAYLWKGKTILMRNALMLLWKRNDKSYLPLIEKSVSKYPIWYDDMAKKVINDLKE